MDNYKNHYDVVIVGGGPAGLSAAIYAARAKYRVLVVEKDHIGGQITITSEVVNYPGIETTSGKELTEKMRVQAANFGAEFMIAEVKGFTDIAADIKTIHTSKGDIKALGIIIATGANPRRIGFTGEKEFQGRGVAYCATCDGEFFTGKEILVVGGGFAAVEEGIFLTKYASKITMLVRGEKFSCAQSVVDELKHYPSISVRFNSEIDSITGASMPDTAVIKNNKTGEISEYHAADGSGFGVFVFAGYVPNTEWLPEEIKRDERNYIITDINQKTSVPGVYAAGDLCVKNLRQVVTAVSDGAVAATSLEKVVAEIHKKYDIGDLTVYGPGMKKPEAAPKEAAAAAPQTEADNGKLLSEAIRSQLTAVFAKLTRNVGVKLWDDGSQLAGLMKNFMDELKGLSDRIIPSYEDASAIGDDVTAPAMELINDDGSSAGIFFHAVPGGHELNSFVIAVYNVGGPGQAVDEEVKNRISAISSPVKIQVLVSLSCTMCPETVMSTQRAATLNRNIRAEMFDLAYFPEMKEKYNVMSVPCTIINGSRVVFGKKNLAEIADILTE